MRIFGPSFPCYSCAEPADAPEPSMEPTCRRCQREAVELVAAALRAIARRIAETESRTAEAAKRDAA